MKHQELSQLYYRKAHFITNTILIFLITTIMAGCKKYKTESYFVNNTCLNKWEIATSDSINSIIQKNLNSYQDTFEFKNLVYHRNKLFNHEARVSLFKLLKTDSIFLSCSKVDEFIIIDCYKSKTDPITLKFYILIPQIKKSVCITYNSNRYGLYSAKTKVIRNDLYNSFVDELKMLYSIKSDTNCYNGEIIITRFTKNNLEVYPFLSDNFCNATYEKYIRLIE